MPMTIEEKKIDPQGRVALPKGWRDEELGGSKIVFLIRENGTIKILPKTRVKLASFFDKAKVSSVHPDPFEDYEGALAKASE